jgi:hypothetical protein
MLTIAGGIVLAILILRFLPELLATCGIAILFLLGVIGIVLAAVFLAPTLQAVQHWPLIIGTVVVTTLTWRTLSYREPKARREALIGSLMIGTPVLLVCGCLIIGG